jgi:BirA family biotin operon repressor/biotin-[acetyl-CoA-carboxylase] ligase
MRFIKLDATSSTNNYLKELAKEQHTEPFTVVSAENQTNGRGQRGSTWVSEEGKNLTFSILLRVRNSELQYIFLLNAAVALSLVDTLNNLSISEISIKWPNDIMSGSKKVGGILIENKLSSGGEITSIVGVGLNVNQKDFEGLPNASSLSVVAGHLFDKEMILQTAATEIKALVGSIAGNRNHIWNRYNNLLFRRGLPTHFVLENEDSFEGTIVRVLENGLLELSVGAEFKTYDVKQIRMIY